MILLSLSVPLAHFKWGSPYQETTSQCCFCRSHHVYVSPLYRWEALAICAVNPICRVAFEVLHNVSSYWPSYLFTYATPHQLPKGEICAGMGAQVLSHSHSKLAATLACWIMTPDLQSQGFSTHQADSHSLKLTAPLWRQGNTLGS